MDELKDKILFNLGYYDNIKFINNLPKHQAESAIDEALNDTRATPEWDEDNK